MKPTSAHTAVLLFTRTSAEEAQAKRFCRSHGKSKAVAAQLITRTKQLVQQAGLPLVIIDSKRQQGSNFGERLQDAFEQVFASGYTKVICLGNDTPGITPATLRAAADTLQQQDFVLGEASDGGVYLLGMHSHTLPQLDFGAVAWRTSDVFKELCLQTAAAPTAILAPILADADSLADLIALSTQRSLGQFANWLRTLLFSFRACSILYTSSISQITPAALALRGPPLS